MPFDSILGVGRSPKITEDVPSNPNNLIIANIAPASIISKTIATSFVESGNSKLIINEDFDSSVNEAYKLTGFTGATDRTNELTFNLTKNMYIKMLNLKFGWNIGGLSLPATWNFQVLGYTSDNNYETIYNYSATNNGTGDTKTIDIEYNNLKFRKLVLKGFTNGCINNNGVTIYFYSIKIVPDALQY